MQHLWSVATWEIETSADDPTSAERIGAPITEYSVVVKGKRDEFERNSESIEIPLTRDLYLLTAWYVHDFLDVLNIRFSDPEGQQLWYSTPRSPYSGVISTRALHVIPISDLWYTIDGVYKFSFYFSNDDGDKSEEGNFKIVLNRRRGN